jgi:hypothetical protein
MKEYNFLNTFNDNVISTEIFFILKDKKYRREIPLSLKNEIPQLRYTSIGMTIFNTTVKSL